MQCESARTESEWLAARAKPALTQWKTYFMVITSMLSSSSSEVTSSFHTRLQASCLHPSHGVHSGPALLGHSLSILSWLARKLPLAKATYLGFPVCSLVDICFQLTSAGIPNTLFLSQVSGWYDLCPWSSPTVTDIILPDSPDLECSSLLRSYSLERQLAVLTEHSVWFPLTPVSGPCQFFPQLAISGDSPNTCGICPFSCPFCISRPCNGRPYPNSCLKSIRPIASQTPKIPAL